mgnify:CR=1 FL=1
MSQIRFIVNGSPIGNQRAADGKHGKYLPAKSRKYQENIAWNFRKALGGAVKPTGKPIEVSVLAFYPVPKSWPVWKQEAALAGDIVPTVKPDVDNIEKAIYDGLNEVAYHDDAQIVNVNGFIKRYSRQPRVEITIGVMDLMPASCTKTEYDAWCRKIKHVDMLV